MSLPRSVAEVVKEHAGSQASRSPVRVGLTLAAAGRLRYDRHAALQPSRLLLDDPGGFMANDRTLVQIRERSYLDLLDLALLVVRQRPRALGLAAAAGIAPFAALNYWVLSNPETSQAIWPALLFLEAPWATLPLTLVLGGLWIWPSPPSLSHADLKESSCVRAVPRAQGITPFLAPWKRG